MDLKKLLTRLERDFVAYALREQGTIVDAAAYLGISYRQIRHLVRKHKIKVAKEKIVR